MENKKPEKPDYLRSLLNKDVAIEMLENYHIDGKFLAYGQYEVIILPKNSTKQMLIFKHAIASIQEVVGQK